MDGPIPLRRGTTNAGLVGASRARLLEALAGGHRALDAAELAEACRLHVTTVRFHLDILCDAGLVRSVAQRTGGRGRPRLLYRAVVSGDDRAPDDRAPDSGAELLAMLLAAHWDDTPAERAHRAERAGRAAAAAGLGTTSQPAGQPTAPAPTLEQAGAQVSARFAALGFDPELRAEGRQVQIRLRACPFRAVAKQHPDVVCSLHLGLLRGALEQLRAPVGTASLDPFVEPRLCLARLDPADQGAPTADRPNR